jgi:hypothetical protein
VKNANIDSNKEYPAFSNVVITSPTYNDNGLFSHSQLPSRGGVGLFSECRIVLLKKLG